MSEDNPFEAFGLVYCYRDGRPVVTETSLWLLEKTHPAAVEREGGRVAYLYLDRPYRVLRLEDRAYCELVPAPGRSPKRAALGA
ncbi:MAG TPA: hypothetical protein VMG32_08170 [Anaeromyxobacteraceae bacterium]|nr:hypothetical protein [Anaeromyxobacteraceae bacterium]